jgi:hypothetical protein
MFEKSRVPVPLKLFVAKHVQQDQRPRWRRFQASKAKNNLQSIILWEGIN